VKVVQEAMGHSTSAITLNVYGHVMPTMGRDAARVMGAALFG
jgi:integrase